MRPGADGVSIPGVVPAVAALVGVALSGCSLVLDFDANKLQRQDAGISMMPACEGLEPNGEFDQAPVIEPGSFDLGFCRTPEGAIDFEHFRFSVAEAQDVTIVIAFDHRNGFGDLNLRLLDLEVNLLEETAGTGDEETIARTAELGNQLPPGDFIAEVFGATLSVEALYTLTLSVD